MEVYSSISTFIILQSHNLYDCIISCTFQTIPKYKNMYNCKYINKKVLIFADFVKKFNLRDDTMNESQLHKS